MNPSHFPMNLSLSGPSPRLHPQLIHLERLVLLALRFDVPCDADLPLSFAAATAEPLLQLGAEGKKWRARVLQAFRVLLPTLAQFPSFFLLLRPGVSASALLLVSSALVMVSHAEGGTGKPAWVEILECTCCCLLSGEHVHCAACWLLLAAVGLYFLESLHKVCPSPHSDSPLPNT